MDNYTEAVCQQLAQGLLLAVTVSLGQCSALFLALLGMQTHCMGSVAHLISDCL